MAVHQAPLSLGFSRQEYWSGLPFPSAMHACMLSRFSHVRLCATPQTAAQQAPLATDSPGKNTGVGCHFLLLYRHTVCANFLLQSPAGTTTMFLQYLQCYNSSHLKFHFLWFLEPWPLLVKEGPSHHRHHLLVIKIILFWKQWFIIFKKVSHKLAHLIHSLRERWYYPHFVGAERRLEIDQGTSATSTLYWLNCASLKVS